MIKKHKSSDRDYRKPGKEAPAEKKYGRSDDRRDSQDKNGGGSRGRSGKDRNGNDSPSREDKPYKGDKPYRGGKPAREDKPSKSDKPYRSDKFNKGGKPEKEEKTYRGDRPNREDRPNKEEKTFKDRNDRSRHHGDKPGKDDSSRKREGRDGGYERKPAGDRERSHEHKPQVRERKPKNFDEPVETRSSEAGEDERLFLKGRHEVVQALESGQQIDSVIISTAVKGPVGSVVRELASKAQVPVKEMNPDLFARKFGEKSQGIVAITGAFSYCTLEEIAEKATASRGVLVALNHVEDARNLGAIVRTVEASGCSGVLLPKHRSAGMTEWAMRTAQGAAAYLPVARVNNIGDALEKLKEMGYWIVGLDGDAEKTYDQVVYSGRIVLVAGGEDAGLGERVRKVCDDVVAIPLQGKTPSLNVSVSTAVVLYEILRQKHFFQK